MRHRVNGQVFDARCPGNTETGFECSLTGGVLSWNDQGASQYFIREVNGGVDSFVGSTTDLSFNVTGDADGYIVRHWINGVPFDALC